MCHLLIEIDQAESPVDKVLEIVAARGFYLRSIRLVPSARSSRADVALSLGGESDQGFAGLVHRVGLISGVLRAHGISAAGPVMADVRRTKHRELRVERV